MALSQKGAGYDHREHIGDPHVKEALDSLANPVQAILTQGNFGRDGIPVPPSPPAQLNVSAVGGIFTATITHNNSPAGVRYRLQWSTVPNFTPGTIVEEELSAASFGGATWQKSLPGSKLYFRVAAKFLPSAITPWVYMGSAAAPTRVG